MKLWVLVGVMALCGGAAQARILGHKPATAAPADAPVCTTVTTEVRKGDVVLSRTSTTHCEADHAAAAAAAPAPRSAQAAPEPQAAEPAPAAQAAAAKPFGAPLKFGSFFSASMALKPHDVLGLWWALEAGAGDACQIRLLRTASAGGYQAGASGCRGQLRRLSAWRFDGEAAELYAKDGALITRLGGSRDRLTGQTAAGALITLTR